MFKKIMAVSSLVFACSISPIIAPQITSDSNLLDGTALAQNNTNTGILRANDPNSRINLRSQPTTDSKSLGYGLTGDGVEIIGCSSEYGDTWLQVRFIKPPYATGWIRSDFVSTSVSLQYC